MIQSINATITPDQLKKLRNIAKIAKKSCPTREFFKYMKFEKVLEMDSDGAFVEQLEISATDIRFLNCGSSGDPVISFRVVVGVIFSDSINESCFINSPPASSSSSKSRVLSL